MSAVTPLFGSPPPTAWPREGQPLRATPDLFEGHPVHRDVEVEIGGRQVRIRAVRPTDAATIEAFVRRLSTQTRYKRFHTGLQRLTVAQLAVLVDVDHRDRETLLAFADRELIGVGQYVREDHDRADLALVVADGWQRHGVGRALSRQLAIAAAESGISVLDSHVLGDNPAPVRLARSLTDCVSVEHDRGDIALTVQLQTC